MESTESNTTGFVVGSSYDQSFFRVLFVEFVCSSNSFVHSDGIQNGGFGIVGVSCVVNTAAFNHQEERLILSIERFNCFLGQFTQGRQFVFSQLAVTALNLVGKVAVGKSSENFFTFLGLVSTESIAGGVTNESL